MTMKAKTITTDLAMCIAVAAFLVGLVAGMIILKIILQDIFIFR